MLIIQTCAYRSQSRSILGTQLLVQLTIRLICLFSVHQVTFGLLAAIDAIYDAVIDGRRYAYRQQGKGFAWTLRGCMS